MEAQNLSDERYFIVFFNHVIDDEIYVSNAGYSNNGYINHNYVVDEIKQSTNSTDVSITNIIEVNKKDYEYFYE